MNKEKLFTKVELERSKKLDRKRMTKLLKCDVKLNSVHDYYVI